MTATVISLMLRAAHEKAQNDKDTGAPGPACAEISGTRRETGQGRTSPRDSAEANLLIGGVARNGQQLGQISPDR